MLVKKIGMITVCCFLTAACGVFPAGAQEDRVIPPEAVEISNQVILHIYQDIFDAKAQYPDLADFGEDCLFKNRHGILLIMYEPKNSKARVPYRLGITVEGLGDDEFAQENGRFHYMFPKAGLKITGFQQKHPLRTQFDVMPLVTQHGMLLEEYQQEFMPLKIFVRPAKERFKIREDIEFDVALKNVSKRHMIVRSLGHDTLYFMINNQVWGTSPLSGQRGGSNEVLRSGEETVLRFKGESFQRPQEVEITCFYRMSLEGVNPIGRSVFVIEE